MTELLENYPLSSCKCYDCADKIYEFGKSGFPTNMSVRNANFSDYYDCIDRNLFKKQIEPRNLDKYQLLNPYAISKSYDNTFAPIKAEGANQDNIVYASNDPRLISVAHNGQVLTLDRPPMNQAVKLNEVYTDPTLKYYGQNYNCYQDINAGDIMYYIDQSIQDAEFQPIFTNNAIVDGEILKDPMGAIKPQYSRIPVIKTDLLDTKHNNYKDVGLSWMRDSLESREDLIALQMRKHNEQRYEPRWTGKLLF